MYRTLIALALATSLLPLGRSWAQDGTADDAAGVDLLGQAAPYRYFMVAKTEQARFEDGIRTADIGHADRVGHPPMRQSPNPPANWTDPDFDDARWPLTRLPQHTGRMRAFSLLCTRTRFVVDDPAGAGELTLELTYRGGVVVYLNGKELARGDMPDGQISPDTPANDYPREVYVDPNGHVLRLGFGDPSKYKDRFAKRTRRLKVAVPAGRLVRGVNVLAVEAHRPITDGVLFTGKTERHSKSYCHWETLAVLEAKLTAPAALSSPKPVKLGVFNLSTLQRVVDNLAAHPGRPLRPVQIAAARGGSFDGLAVARSDGAIANLSAKASALAGDAGTIPAATVSVRFARPDGERGRGQPGWFDRLENKSAAAIEPGPVGALAPIWITVAVPADAKAGQYAGTVTVSADDAEPVAVPVQLTVADWTLPPVTQSESWWWAVSSPESLAKAYDVELWSDRHLELLGQSFALCRQIGTRSIYVPLFRQSHLGNEQSMVRWIKGADGSWSCDFSVLDKYLDAATANLGRLEMVCIYAWPRSSGGAYFGQAKRKTDATPFRFTLVDPKTGELTEAEGPTWDDEKEIRALLAPAFAGIRKRLADRGVDASAMMVGISHDVMPSKNAVAALKDASGGAKWVVHCHPERWDIHGEPAGYLAHVWGTRGPAWPDSARDKRNPSGWQLGKLYATFPRYGSGVVGKLDNSSPPSQYRAGCESAMVAGFRGYGWIGADFWYVLEDGRGRQNTLLDRYPYDARGNLGLMHSIFSLLGRGDDGPVATVRHQNARAGLQEAEARAFIEKALADEAARAKLGDALAERCEELLDGRQKALVFARQHWDMMLVADWEQSAGDLFALAGEVANKLK